MDDGTYHDLGRDLRRGVGEEFRAEAEETERAAAQAARRRRTLTDVMREAMARGDDVTAEVPGRTFLGTVVHAGSDLVSLATPAGRVDLPTTQVALTLQVARRRTAVGRDPQSGPGTFKARLLEIELGGSSVALGIAAFPVERVGRILAVGSDHVVVMDGNQEWFVPLAAISYLIERH